MQDQALRRELMEEIHWLVQAELSVPLGQLAAPHCQQRSPLGLIRPPGGPTDDHATAL